MIERSVFLDIRIEMRPISENNKVDLAIDVGDVGDFGLYEIRREGSGASTASIPAEDIVVEKFFEVDGGEAAFVDSSVIICCGFGKMQRSGTALDPFHT